MAMLDNGPFVALGYEILGIPYPTDQHTSVSNWHACLRALCDQAQRATVFSRLSRAQTISLTLLEEWWWYRCDDKARSDIILPPSLRQWDLADARHLYKKKLYLLWYWEFTSMFYDMEADRLEVKMARLAFVRQTAAEAAAVDRTSHAVYHAISDTHMSSTSANVYDVHPYAQARLKSHIPACVEACSWQGSARAEKQYPYFLWDKQERRTVHFEKDVPPYTVISHTWGRFRVQNQETSLLGVPWPVPVLDSTLLFDVNTLPDILYRFPLPTRYLWLDLVCIPQDGRALQDIEIGRQAGIFMTARFATVWLNQIRGWNGLQSAIEWASLQYLGQNSYDVYNIQALLHGYKEAADQPSNLTIPARLEDAGTKKAAWIFEDRYDKTVTPDRWFTSLWTLQEACLRPDMVLCDRDWNMLSVGAGESQYPILLDHLVALFERPHSPRLKDVPNSVHEIRVLLDSSGLRTLLNMHPVNILIMGEVRYCEDLNRAKAVMSALGTTNWYTNGSASDIERSPQELVLGKYPLRFLHECQRQFGSLFFYSVNVGNLHDGFYELDELDKETLDMFVGSLLPFNVGWGHPKEVFELLTCPEDHPTVNSWAIQRDGSVSILQVGIVSSYIASFHDPARIEADIKPPRRGFRLPPKHDELHQWMGSFRPNVEKHAICLFRNEDQLEGVIIEKISPGGKEYVGVGTFRTLARSSFPIPVAVDWCVL